MVRVLVGEAPLEPDRRHTLATTDYLAGEGDGYDVLRGARLRVDSSGGPHLVNVIAEFLSRSGAVAVAEGRIRAE